MAVVAWRATTAVSSPCATRCPTRWCEVRVVSERGSYWHADVVEVIEPSPDRVDSLCTIAGRDGAGCCDLAFADPAAARRLKGAVVANQLERLGGHEWSGVAEEVGDGGATGWRTRVRLDVSMPAGRASTAITAPSWPRI